MCYHAWFSQFCFLFCFCIMNKHFTNSNLSFLTRSASERPCMLPPNTALHQEPHMIILGWSDGSVIESTCSLRGSGFNSQYPHGDAQLSLTPVLGDLTPSPCFCRHQACTWHRNIQTRPPPICIKKRIKKESGLHAQITTWMIPFPFF